MFYKTLLFTGTGPEIITPQAEQLPPIVHGRYILKWFWLILKPLCILKRQQKKRRLASLLPSLMCECMGRLHNSYITIHILRCVCHLQAVNHEAWQDWKMLARRSTPLSHVTTRASVKPTCCHKVFAQWRVCVCENSDITVWKHSHDCHTPRGFLQIIHSAPFTIW